MKEHISHRRSYKNQEEACKHFTIPSWGSFNPCKSRIFCKCKHFPIPTYILYYNFDAFIYFLGHGHSLDEIDILGMTCLHSASRIGSLPIVQYLIEKGADFEKKDEHQYILLFFLHILKVIYQLFNIL